MFSVVIPVYNHGPYLAECLLSAGRSPLVSEILAADDGSKDDSRARLAALVGGLGGRVRDLTPDPPVNEGAHAKLNRLVRAASNEWIAVLNSDDAFVTGRFELLARLIRQERFDLAFGDLVILDQAGVRLGVKRGPFSPQYPFPASFDVEAMSRGEGALDLLASQNLAATTSNMVFRRSLFDKVGGFAPYRYVHDWDFVLRAGASGGAVRYVPHFFSCYRIHASNTISEDSGRVDAEVKDLFARLDRDFPETAARPSFRAAVESNEYLRSRAHCPLALVLPDTPESAAYEASVRARIDPVEVVRRVEDVRDGDYVYAPADVSAAMPPEHLADVVLGAAYQEADFFLVADGLSEPPQVQAADLANHLVTHHSRAGSPLAGPLRGRLARFPDGAKQTRDLSDLLGAPATERDGVISLGGASLEIPRRTPPRRASIVHRGERPVVLAMPAFFAVGGVERQVTDMMRQLRGDYDFVVVCNERLREEQGSLRPAAAGLAVGFHELAELAPHSLFLDMLERLRAIYRPSLLWIANGSPWLCDHAMELRGVFHDAAIVDQRCYDDRFGWIERAGEPGIQACDRFVAVNTRIQQVFTGKLAMPESKIDLIYSPVDASILGPVERTAAEKDSCAAKCGLPRGRRILGWVGRLTQQKRPLDFLEMVRRAREEGDPSLFLMVGDGELGPKCSEFIERQGLDNVVRISYCSTLWELYCLMSGFIVTSEYEGLPIAMLQALAMGVPVLATDVGDIALVVERHRAGVVLPTIDDLAGCMERYRAWIADLDRWRANAQESAADVRAAFSAEKIADDYRRCFAAALTPYSGGRA